MKTIELRYRTLEQLLAEASVDLPTLHQEGFIEPAQLIKVAQRVNYDLGLKLHQEKIAVLDVQRAKARLPTDLYLLQHAAICAHFTIEEPVITGTQTEEVVLFPPSAGQGTGEGHPAPCLTRCGDHVYLKHRYKTQVRRYDLFAPLTIKPPAQVSAGCPNIPVRDAATAWLHQGFLHTSFPEGTLLVHYLGNLEDENGQLLVPDHPQLNEYYEYAIKQRVLENMLLEGENVADKLTLIEKRYRDARNNALSLVNTPDFQEFKDIWELNRKAMLQRFYSIIY